ncbi:LytR/AlgR family response regulator transcription factor [Anaerosporobacter faecicola]|uniref:LytR/AlgR family response regulator transcription factor n=1 Tax=Anaerosporobacter faecicola TaxID=2718714 RepID=UPI00143B894C|nr:LytTR family DNA-binding domain-containing protein [Anaerosporobacter faecicola]
MKIKLRLSNARKDQLAEDLSNRGIEITENSDLILTEDGYYGGELYCKEGTDTVIVAHPDILYIESLGKDVYVHTINKSFTTTTRIYVLEKNLPNEQFVRISNSVIIRKNAIQRIRPGFSQKFYLTLKNGDTVDVTRTYYYRFKEYYGI